MSFSDSSGGAGLPGGGGGHGGSVGRSTGGAPIGPGSGGIRFGHHPDHRPRLRAQGLVARIMPLRGITPKHVLHHAIYLPAILNTLALTEAGLHTDYDTLSAGQFSQPAMGGPDEETQLTTVPIDTLILAYDAQWMVVTGQHRHNVKERLRNIVKARSPVHLVIHWHPHRGEPPLVELKVTIRQMTMTINPGENDTEYFSLDVHQWRDQSVPTHSHRRHHHGHGRKRGHELPTTHKLKSDDTLHSLAHEYYGTFHHWRLIRDANGIPKRWGPKTAIVKLRGWHVGSKVKIPKPPAHHHHHHSSGGAGV